MTVFATAAELEAQIAFVLNAASTGYGAAIDKGIYLGTSGGLTPMGKVRRDAAYEVIRAAASNTDGSYWGEWAALTDVDNDAFLPAHAGEPGIPVIVPFSGAPAREGMEATPQEIGAWRDDSLLLYASVAHDQADENLMPSAVSCRYSLLNKRLKFTGLSCQVPLIIPTDDMADTKIPVDIAPTVVKLAIPKLCKEGDLLYMIASTYGALGQNDLIELRGGALKVQSVPSPHALMAMAQQARA